MNVATSGIVVLGAVLVCLAVAALVIRAQRRTQAPYPPPEDWGVDPDDRKWETEATELRHKALSDVRETAKAWAASITALLTIGTTVGFVKGGETFADLGGTEGNFAFWLVIAAGLLAGAAIATAAFAAQGTPQRYERLDGWTLSKISRERTRRATVLLLWSRVLAVIAALAVFGGFAISWQAGIGEEESTAINAIAVAEDGSVRCGELSSSSDGKLSLVTGDETISVGERSDVDTVESCPAQ